MSKDLYSKRLEDLFSGSPGPAPDPTPTSPPTAQPPNGLNAPAGATVSAGTTATLNGHHTPPAEVEALRARIAELEIELAATRARVRLKQSTGLLELEPTDLRLSRELLELAVEGANEGLWDWDLVTNTVTFSSAWKRLIGYSSNELENTFATFESHLHPDERERVLANLWAYLNGQQDVYIAEYRFRHKDGSYRWMLARGKALRDTNGRPTRMAGSHLDITERKLAEEALRESEERYRSFIERTTDLVQSVGPDGRFLYVNRAWHVTLGYTPEDLATLTVFDIINPEDLPHCQLLFRKIFQGESVYNIEVTFITKSGARVQLEGNSMPHIINGQVVSAQSIFRDVTERRRTEAELRSLFAAMNDVVLVYDSEGRYLRIVPTNPLLPYRPSEEVLGKRMHDVMPAAKADELLTHLRRALVTRQLVRAEYQLTINDREYWFDASISPLSDNTVFWVARDITERKQAERLIARRAAELEALNSLSQALSRIQDLAATLKTVGENVIRIFNAHSGYIALYDAITDHVELPYFFEEGHAISVPPMPLGQGPTAHIIRSRRTLVINSEIDRRMKELGARTYREAAQQPRSWVGVPILFGYEVVGVLSLGSLQEGHFSDEDVHLLETIASSVAASIQKARLFDQAQKRATELATVAEVSAAAAAARDPNVLLQTMVDLTKSRFGLYHAHVYLLNQPGDMLVLAAGAGEAGARMLAQGWSIPLNHPHSLVARAARTRQGVVSNDVRQEPDFLPNPLLPETRAEMAIPLIVGAQVLGVLDVQSERVGRFTPEDVQIQMTLAAQIAIALQNARSFEQTERLVHELNVMTQRLTGEGWQTYTHEAGLADQSFVYDLTQVRRVPTSLAISDHQDMAPFSALLATPLSVQGTTIGQLAIADPELPTEDARGILAAVAERLSAHLENLRLTDTTQAALAETEQLYDFSSRLNAALTFEEVVCAAASVIGADACRLLTFELDADDRPEWMIVKAIWPGGENDAVLGERRRVLEFPLAHIWLSNPFEPLLIGDWVHDARLGPTTRAALPGAGAVVLMTLMLGGKWVGMLASAWRQPQTFSERDVRRFRTVAAQVAVAVNNRLLFEKTQENLARQERLSTELETVAQVSTAASTLLERDRLLQQVVDLTCERFGLYHAQIFLSDDVSGTLQLAAGAGEVGRQLVAECRPIPVLLENSSVARAARTRQPVLVNDTQALPGFRPYPLLPRTRSELAVPLIAGERVLGVLDVLSDQPDHFTQEDIRIKSTLAAQVAIALQNANLYAEQTATVARLRELDQLKSSFLANMSHELRTPLNSILGFTDVILEGLDGPLTDRMENDLKIVQKNGQHLLGLINDILDMAKIEAGRMTITPERFDLGQVINEVLEITLPLAREKRLYLRSEIDSSSDLDVDADHMRVRQVLLNLVGNAIKFTEHGGVCLRAERVRRSGEDGGDLLHICVADTGIGIPPDKLEMIFEAFSQVDTSTTRKVGGTGLGLAISRHLIELHGGRLWAESSGIPGEGASFHIELPVKFRPPLAIGS
ncbi:MAG: GAF domain-containing protein [Anaerolineales bacterium]|nr:GAF domain-containing protein [Anaerolineales bacterium]